MKPIRKLTRPVLAGLILSSGASLASDNFQEGDLALAFYEVIGGVVQSNTYVVNLGQASLYRENTQNNVSISTVNPGIASSNIAADLSATFGSDWADSGTVYWLVIGGVSGGGTPDPYFPGTQPTNGDPARTTYFSKARTSLDSNATAKGTTVSGTLSPTNRGIFSNAVIPFLTGCSWGIDAYQSNTSTSGANLAAAILPISNLNTVDEYLPPATLTFFGVSATYDPRQALNNGQITGTAGVEGALDMYRIINTATGADLTAGASTGNASAGVAQFIGTLSLATNGDLKISGIPSAGSFSTWASANGVTGGVTGDSDNDGINNLMEYALSLNPAASDGAPGTFTNGVLSFTKRATAVTNGDVTYGIQQSDDLNTWQNVTPTTNTASAITYQLPTGSPKKFARLVVTKAP
jgi:hypothetical protein